MKKLVLCALFFSFVSLTAQYYEMPSFYWNSLSAVNPANSGFNADQQYSVQGLYRNQIQVAPYSIWASADYKLKKINSAIGINYNHFDNVIGKSNTFKLNYNFQPDLGENHKLSIGLSFAIDQVRMDAPRNIFSTVSRYSFPNYISEPDHERNALEETSTKMGAGIMYRFKNLELGGSVTNHIDPQYQYGEWNVKNERVFNYYINYKFSLFRNVQMNPIFAMRARHDIGYALSMLNLNFIVKERFLMGIQGSFTVSNTEKLNFMLGYEFAKKFQVYLGYGISPSKFTNYTTYPNFELALTYLIQRKEEVFK